MIWRSENIMIETRRDRDDKTEIAANNYALH